MADLEPGELAEDLWDPLAGLTVWKKLVSASPGIAQQLKASPDRARAILNF